MSLCPLFVAVPALTQVGATAHAPAFFWSPRADLGLGQHMTHSHETSASDLHHAVESLLGRSSSPRPAFLAGGEGGAAPEVQLVFLADGLDTESVRSHGASLVNLERVVQGSAASLTIPFAKPVTWKPLTFERTTQLTAESAESYLSSHTEIFSNGEPDLLVVHLGAAGAARDTLLAHDAAIARLSKAVDEGTRSNYAALLTGSQLAAVDQQFKATVRRMLADDGETGDAVSTITYLYTGPTLLAAQLVMLMLFLIFISGFCCLFSLQTPKRFDDPKNA